MKKPVYCRILYSVMILLLCTPIAAEEWGDKDADPAAESTADPRGSESTADSSESEPGTPDTQESASEDEKEAVDDKKDSENDSAADTADANPEKPVDAVDETKRAYWEETMRFGTAAQKEQVLNAMRYVNNPIVVTILVSSLETELNDDIKHKLVQLLYEKAPQDAFPVLVKQLEEAKDPRVISTAAAALGELKMMEGVYHLVKLLDHRELPVQKAVVQALGKIGDASAGSVLLKMLDEPKTDSDLRYDLILALGLLKHSPAYDTLRSIALNQAKPTHKRGLAIYSLGEIGNAAILPDLLTMLQRERMPQIKLRVIGALGKLMSAEANTYIIAAMSDSDEGVRKAAVDTAKLLATEEFRRPLMYRLKYDHSALVMTAAAEALHAIGHDELGSVALEKFNASMDPNVLRKLLELIREIKPEKAREILATKKRQLEASKHIGGGAALAEEIQKVLDGWRGTAAEPADDSSKAAADADTKAEPQPERIYLE